jgi:hypothetical protein
VNQKCGHVKSLRDDVVDVERQPARLGAKRDDRLADRKPLQVRDVRLDHEAAPGSEVHGGVLEAGDLRVLRDEVEDRVEDEVDDRELSRDACRREVADRHLDLVRPGLLAQTRDHRLGVVDP